MKLNETPVRTSRNFNINNIKIEDVKIPEVIEEFNNVNIIKESDNIEITSNVSDCNLTYGIENSLTDIVNEKSNCKFKIIVDDKKENENRIEFTFDDENKALFENVEIVVEENCKTTVILKYESENNDKYFHNGIIRLFAKEDSKVNIIIINLLNIESNNFIAIESELQKNAKVNYTIVDFGGKNSITNYFSNLIGENSDNSLNTIYLGKENQLFDLNYI